MGDQPSAPVQVTHGLLGRLGGHQKRVRGAWSKCKLNQLGGTGPNGRWSRTRRRNGSQGLRHRLWDGHSVGQEAPLDTVVHASGQRPPAFGIPYCHAQKQRAKGLDQVVRKCIDAIPVVASAVEKRPGALQPVGPDGAAMRSIPQTRQLRVTGEGPFVRFRFATRTQQAVPYHRQRPDDPCLGSKDGRRRPERRAQLSVPVAFVQQVLG
jgi:hypothetical protein